MRKAALALLLSASPALAQAPPPDTPIIFVDGTSNGYGFALPGQGDPPPYRGSIYNCSWWNDNPDDGRCEWVNPAREPIHPMANGRGHGAAMYMASKLIGLGKATKVTIVPCGRNGGLGTRLPNSTPWTSCTRRISRAIGTGGTVKALLWAPGANDAGNAANAAAYRSRLQTIADSYRALYGPIPIVMLRIGTAPPGYTGCCWDQVRQAQTDFAAENTEIYVVDAEPLPKQDDGRHLTVGGYRIFGEDAAIAVPNF